MKKRVPEKLKQQCEALVSMWDKGGYDNFKDAILDCRSLSLEVPVSCPEQREIDRVLTEATTGLARIRGNSDWDDPHGLIDASYIKKEPIPGKTAKSEAPNPTLPKKAKAKGKATKAIQSKSGARCGLVDRTGEVVCELEYFDASIVGENRIAVWLKRYGRVGLCDFFGKLLIEARFSRIGNFSNGVAAATIDGKRKSSQTEGGKYGFVTPDGEFAIPPEFEACNDFSDGLAAVNLGGHNQGWMVTGGTWGFIDREGEWVLPADGRFEEVGAFSGGLAPVKLSGTSEWCYIDTKGERVISLPPAPKNSYYNCYSFSEGLARIVEKNFGGSAESDKGRFWFIDKTGAVAIGPASGTSFASGDFSESLAAVKRNEKFGYIGIDGTIKIEPAWGQVYPFSEGLAGVRQGGTKTGFIDQTGTLVLPCRYKYASMFSHGLFVTYF